MNDSCKVMRNEREFKRTNEQKTTEIHRSRGLTIVFETIVLDNVDNDYIRHNNVNERTKEKTIVLCYT